MKSTLVTLVRKAAVWESAAETMAEQTVELDE